MEAVADARSSSLPATALTDSARFRFLPAAASGTAGGCSTGCCCDCCDCRCFCCLYSRRWFAFVIAWQDESQLGEGRRRADVRRATDGRVVRCAVLCCAVPCRAALQGVWSRSGVVEWLLRAAVRVGRHRDSLCGTVTVRHRLTAAEQTLRRL